MKKLVFFIALFISSSVIYGQEICDDGIDNDADGDIDLFDSDCDCDGFGLSMTPTSLIPNPSFEDYSCCPTTTSQMYCADTWIQASDATSDYLNTCMGFTSLIPFDDPALPPPGGGDGYAGFHNSNSYKEYVGACLTGPMLAGTCYTLNLWIAHSTGLTDINLSLFGSPTCADLPWAGYDCPIGSGSWELLDQQFVSVDPAPGGDWSEVTLNFTPTVDINAVAIGGSCTPTSGTSFMFVDELILAECTAFAAGTITETGNWCDGDLMLEADLDTTGGTWQWYKDSIALVGETSATLDLMPHGAGDYTAIYTIGSDCEGMSYTVTIPDAPVADFTYADGCEDVAVTFTDASIPPTGGSITGWDWDFGDGGTSTATNPSYTYTTPGTYTVTLTVTSDLGCTHTITQDIDISTQPTAGTDNSTSICNTAGSTVDMNTLLSGADAGGTWAETSASGSFDPATGVLDVSGLAAGIYTFTYTLTAAPPCVDDVADFTVTVEEEVNAGADNTATLCNTAGSTIDLNTILSGADAGGIWAETTSPTSGSFTPATGVFDASGLTPGDYSFTYTLIGVAPCPNDIADFTITVTDLPNAGADNATSICNTAGSSVDMNTLLSGADAGGTWSETTTSGAFDPATGILDTDGLTAGTYNFIYDIAAVGPCPGDQASFDVTVEEEVNAGDDNSTSICNTAGSSVDLNTLLSADADAGGIWAETSASGAFDPATGVLNTDGLAAGTYTFTYSLNAIAPCIDDVSNFTVTVEQEVNAGADNVTQLCNYPGASVDLNTLLSADADAGGTWNETTSSGAFDPTTGILNADGLAGGTYDFTYFMDAIAPCVDDEANFSVTVDQVPSIDPLTDEEMCDEENHTAQVFNSDVAGTTIDWTNTTGTDIGFGLSGTGNIGSYTAANGSTSDMSATVEVTPTSPAGCVGETESFNVTVHPLPLINFSGDKLIGCEPLQVNFTNESVGSGTSCEWDFGNGVTATGCGIVSNTYDSPGEYDVSLTITTDYGCTSSDTYTEYISVSPRANAEFSYSPNGAITIEDTRVEFTNSSLNADGYLWDFGDGSPSSSVTDPTHSFPEIGDQSYTVMLTAQSDAGCPDTTTKVIHVQDIILFYVPNIFTPDGDEYNETFQPVFYSGYDPYDFHMTIFNRWGEIVFETYNVSKGWNGTYGDRGLVEDGVYIWQIEFKETMSDKRHKHRGHVTILK